MSIEQERAAAAAEQRELIRREIRNSGIPRPVLRDTGQAPVTDATPIVRTGSSVDPWLVRYQASGLLLPEDYGTVWDPMTWDVPIYQNNTLAQYATFWSWLAQDADDEARFADATGSYDGEFFISGDHPIDGWSWEPDGFKVTVVPDANNGNWFHAPLTETAAISPRLADFTLLWDFTSGFMEGPICHNLFSPQESNNNLSFSYGPLLGAGSPILGYWVDGVGVTQVPFSVPDEINFDGTKRVVLSCDRDGYASVYVNGSLIGSADFSGAENIDLIFTRFGGFAPTITTTLHEFGYLIGYAATAEDVATNPALTTRYGLAARQNQWTAHLTGAATAVIV